MINKRKYLQCLSSELKKLYEQETVLCALDYEGKLLMKIESRLHEIVPMLEALQLALIHEREQAKLFFRDEILASTNTHYIVDWDKVRNFERYFFENRHEMEKVAAVTRSRYEGLCSKNINELLYMTARNLNAEVLIHGYYDIIKEYDYRLSAYEHNTSILGSTLLRELTKNLPETKDINKILNKAMTDAINIIQLNENEALRTAGNNSLSKSNLCVGPWATILIRIPRPMSLHEEKYATTLKIQLMLY